MKMLLYASHICYIDADGKLEVGVCKEREHHRRHKSTYACHDVPDVGM